MDHMKSSDKEDEAESTAMRFLIHYVGDIHQPLHASTRLDKEYPKGDRGGNDFPIPSMHSLKELHAVWDSVIFEFNYYPNLPFSDSDWDEYTKYAQDLMTKYKTDLGDVTSFNPDKWADESFEITMDFVYKGIKENEELPENYQTSAREIAEKRLVQAGHRLASTLMKLNLSKRSSRSSESLFLQL